ncbi:ankyrin repeat-containing domain protein [Chaetomium tenue]|uniref:Ankyrin repeat-containing domain protein n=1 Tax=Chaetomium tenue TaxID=1854479 RepID=A0ACB7PEM0_9PEZI|nr:ankyrin repeat-containing domain protein [Chaetomium globosum]
MDFDLRLSSTHPIERRRLQNRLAQRKFRLKKAADRAHMHDDPSPAHTQPETQTPNLISSNQSTIHVPLSPYEPSARHTTLDPNDVDFSQFVATESFLPDVGVPMVQGGFESTFGLSFPQDLSHHDNNDGQNPQQGPILPPPLDQVLYEVQPDNSLRVLSTAPPEASLDGWIGTLHIAAQGGNEGIVRMLLQQGQVDCNEQDSDGRTALMHAVIEGHEAVVRLLLAHAARVGDLDRDRRSALHLAILHRRESILRVFLDCGDPGLDLDAYDIAGWTPLHMAVERGFTVAVELLLQNGANMDTKARKCHLMGRGAAGHAEI